jgi:pimeloyl-ACP methyl ester carboxylesterase
MASVDFEQGPGGAKLAFHQDGSADDLGRCGFFWLGGFMSDMTGTKAESLAALARETRRPGLRFDYSGHGQSGGLFTDGTISDWLEQAIHMFIAKTNSKRIVVGSSMGGWLALLLARTLLRDDPRAAKRIAGIVFCRMGQNICCLRLGLKCRAPFVSCKEAATRMCHRPMR